MVESGGADGRGAGGAAPGVAGAAIGVVAAGAAAGVALERLTVGRGMRRKARLALDAAGPYGTLRGTPGTAVADDGTELYYEVDEVRVDRPTQPAPPRPPAGCSARRPQAPAATVVFSHGYCLSQDSWHFQRAALRGGGAHRLLGPAQPRPLRAGPRQADGDARSPSTSSAAT